MTAIAEFVFKYRQYFNSIKINAGILATGIAACNRHGVLPGIPCGDPVKIRFWKEQGMRVFWAVSDIGSLWAYAKQSLEAIRAELAKP